MKNEKYLEKIQGCMIGGAIGDALGYPIEFMSLKTIQYKYGKNGLTHYQLHNDKALISDDTQMSLFTANGLLYCHTKNDGTRLHEAVYDAYLDWYATQISAKNHHPVSWLYSCKEMHDQRAPGNTCLQALQSKKMGTIEKPINHSKGCGGIMRVAPLALYGLGMDDDYLDMEGANISAITHGHPLGYLPASFLTHLIHHIIIDTDVNLFELIEKTKDQMKHLFGENMFLSTLLDGVDLAVKYSQNNDLDTDNISKLGEGWVAEEALWISLYCSLKYQNDFSKAIIAAVNHSGDSDSTGAITGNIVGALAGYEKIDASWKTNLECMDLLQEISKDLAYQCDDSKYLLHK